MKGFDSRTVGHHRRKSLELLHERLERVRDHAVVAAVRHEEHLLRLVEVCLALVELVLRKRRIFQNSQFFSIKNLVDIIKDTR